MAAIQLTARVSPSSDHSPANSDPLKSIQANGVKLYYVEQGSGEPVVLVHGSINDYRSWTSVIPALAERYHAIAYSRRYAFPNHWVEGGDNSVATNAEDLYAFVSRLGLGRVHLAGHSYGGFTALVCALRHPEIVKSLILEEPAALPLVVGNPDDPRQILALFMKSPRTALSLIRFGATAIAPATRAFERRDTDAAVKVFMQGVLGRPIVLDELPAFFREQVLANGGSLEVEMGEGLVPFSRADARRISAPALLVGGDRTPRFFTFILDQLEQALPNCKRVTLSGVSHDLHLSDPEGFNRAALEFLAAHKS